MDAPSFSEFDAAARREGDDEIVPRDRPAGAVLETHEHPFADATYRAARRHPKR